MTLNMSPSALEYLNHILDETRYLQDQTGKTTKEQFLSDETLQRAFVRSLEIIGEAVRKIPPEIRSSHPSIDWRAISGMRDRLIHGYFGVDYDIVWDAVSVKVPELQSEIIKIIDATS
jgi:uncharacterized protein with HEPN domain